MGLRLDNPGTFLVYYRDRVGMVIMRHVTKSVNISRVVLIQEVNFCM